jgi:hypothetical protein
MEEVLRKVAMIPKLSVILMGELLWHLLINEEPFGFPLDLKQYTIHYLRTY